MLKRHSYEVTLNGYNRLIKMPESWDPSTGALFRNFLRMSNDSWTSVVDGEQNYVILEKAVEGYNRKLAFDYKSGDNLLFEWFSE